jgi:hypothetical protein
LCSVSGAHFLLYQTASALSSLFRTFCRGIFLAFTISLNGPEQQKTGVSNTGGTRKHINSLAGMLVILASVTPAV